MDGPAPAVDVQRAHGFIATVRGMSFEFELTTERPSPDTAIIAVGGEIDIFTAPDVRRVGLEAVTDGATRVILDLSRTTFLDSTGLGVIIGLSKRVRPSGGDVVIVNIDAGIARTFEITGLNEIFRICETRAEALEAAAEAT